ncbi:2'-5' RNA ligase family protein [Pontibacter sp. E15-1]|uniref:2'-5' RNA ligase family protein n=1 Tax=Pontibacter sp. E15-1 TaxID=2919918 RepID=UPI001F4F304F|nr:2'-5' RNA ligase family protein [Pontibacter sp. E15-1]MCJ8163719.1 2'-5' RNA ligase family protein [Pontibacter sp. E15-1]
MIAIASLLDKTATERVSDLTDQLEKKFGISGVKITPYPHLTALTAEVPDMEEFKEYLESTCLETRKLTVRTTGLGVFPGPNPVIFIPVLRTPPLNNLHERLHRDISEMSTEMGVYYNPKLWLPHITLALGDTTQELLGPVLNFLGTFNFNWEITLDNLTIMQKCGEYYLKEDAFQFGKRELIN